ncbi:hypothetical protein GPALN_011314 [Globodera pallida]|nr:hypothetical protein GPALN_011314 [Globodera pallida]
MNYQQPMQQIGGGMGNQQQQQTAHRPINPTAAAVSQNMSPNVAPSPQQQQMTAYQMSMYHHQAAGGTPFSPHSMYSQQMMTPQMVSQQQQFLPNAPATPATPQMSQSIGTPVSMQNMQQPGSVQLQQPGSVGMVATPAAPYSVGASTTGGPASNQPIAGPHSNQPTQQTTMSQQQQQQQQQQLPSAQSMGGVSTQTEFDPIGTAKSLILKDLRRAIVNLNQCAERALDCFSNPNQQSLQTAERFHEDGSRKAASTAVVSTGGPHSNLGLMSSSGGPHSNLGLMNPHSVQNPLSVQNPQSSSSDEQQHHQQRMGGGKDGAAEEELTVAEQYAEARDQFMNACDNIERNMQLILEVNRQQGKLYNQQANSAVAWVEVPSMLNVPTTTLPHVLSGYTELMNADKQAIKGNIDSLNNLLMRLGGGGKDSHRWNKRSNRWTIRTDCEEN